MHVEITGRKSQQNNSNINRLNKETKINKPNPQTASRIGKAECEQRIGKTNLGKI